MAAQDRAVAEGGTPSVSECEPSCAIFARESSVYSISGVKANVGHLWAKSKMWKKTDLGREYVKKNNIQMNKRLQNAVIRKARQQESQATDTGQIFRR